MVPSGMILRRRCPFTVLGWLLVVLSGTILMAATAGCSGCRKSDDQAKTEEEKKKEEELAKKKAKAKKPPFKVGDLETLPSEGTVNRNFVKPGHTVTAWVPAVSNDEDLRADFETSVTDSSSRPIPVGDTRYHMVMSRPAVLPKGQEKYLESTFFIPVEAARDSSNVFLQHRLKAVRGGRIVHENAQIARQMPAYQYLFAVLSGNPNVYGYLKQLESTSPAYDELLDDGSRQVFYRVVLPTIEQRVPLPSHPFSWTTVAYVLWDGLQPSGMTPDQQTAMVDWLHWGGQLIISGPLSLDQLAGSFLDPYLPATAESSVALGPADFVALNQAWALTPKAASTRLTLNVQETSPIVGVRLAPRPGSEVHRGDGRPGGGTPRGARARGGDRVFIGESRCGELGELRQFLQRVHSSASVAYLHHRSAGRAADRLVSPQIEAGGSADSDRHALFHARRGIEEIRCC